MVTNNKYIYIYIHIYIHTYRVVYMYICYLNGEYINVSNIYIYIYANYIGRPMAWPT